MTSNDHLRERSSVLVDGPSRAAARSQLYDNPFPQYALPQAILRFRQGFGRLIRTSTDRGVVVVLDRRITSRSYGGQFLRSLPGCTVARPTLDGLPAVVAQWLGA